MQFVNILVYIALYLSLDIGSSLGEKLNKDYYEILGVSKDSTIKQIKKAFRKLAVKYHPDKNKKKDAEKKFAEIAQAYEVLSNAEKKKKYDHCGEDCIFGNSQGSGGGSNFDFHDFFKHFDEYFEEGPSHHQQHHHHHHSHDHFSFNFDDLFSDMEQDEMGKHFSFGNFGNDDFGSSFSSFGDGDSFFGNHFGSNQLYDDDDDDHYNEVHQSHSHYQNSGGGRCKTVTQRVGNMVTTYTQCS